MALIEPKVLLVTTRPWVASARLALAFRDSGCTVSMICPDGHPIELTSLKARTYHYRGLAPLDSTRAAIAYFQPDLVVPCDDLARAHLNSIHLEESRRSSGTTALLTLIERSLGDPYNYAVQLSRSALIALAREEGIAAPETRIISSIAELRSWIGQFGLPTVLKTSGTSGGIGVKKARFQEEAEQFFRALQSPQRMDQAIKRALVDRDTSLILPWLQRQTRIVNAQQFLPYTDATIAIACWQGKVLASISTEVLRTTRPNGPSSVVRLVHNADMKQAAAKLAGCLGLSGLYGFDFLVDAATGKAWLIEMNPRATQTCYLPLGTGHNLTVALTATLLGRPIPESNSITDRDVIALFPHEWLADSTSKFLNSAYHDVPWSEPKLVEAGVKSRLRNGPWLTYENLDRIKSWLRYPRNARRIPGEYL